MRRGGRNSDECQDVGENQRRTPAFMADAEDDRVKDFPFSLADLEEMSEQEIDADAIALTERLTPIANQ
jgi:hypothetical protein